MKKQFMRKGIFERPFMNSRIKSAEMTLKEKLLGYLVGPFGPLALMAVVNQLAELYYTEVFYIDRIFGVGTYLVMSWPPGSWRWWQALRLHTLWNTLHLPRDGSGRCC